MPAGRGARTTHGRAFAAAFVAALLLLPAAPASAKLKTYTLRYGPVRIAGFNVKFPKAKVRTPRVGGYIVHMDASLVNSKGRKVTIRDVMLHHLVFHRRRETKVRNACTSPHGEAFFGTGEENQQLRLPAGYGYRISKDDKWRVTAMLMSHSMQAFNVYIQYRVTVETDRRLTPVHAFWVRANGCSPSVSYPVYGGGEPGSTDQRRFDWTAPYNARIVAVGGHLHGGAKDMRLSQPRCGDRRLLDTRPFFGQPDHLYYRVRPVLHEPGPMDTHYFLSRTGISIRRGEKIRLTGAYDASQPHPRVMSIMHVYVVRDPHPPKGCAPLPSDVRELQKSKNARLEPPVIKVPLNGLNDEGHTFEITDPPWPVRQLSSGAVVDLRNDRFSKEHIALPVGSELTWRFVDRTAHNVLFANGPRVVGSPTLSGGKKYTTRFAVAGHYEVFCYLHPLTMHQVIDVQPSAGAASAGPPSADGGSQDSGEFW
jgi:plastocyanin